MGRSVVLESSSTIERVIIELMFRHRAVVL
jgi:hypothetical protein